ncbi:MAG: prepilin-type N-terminal cleavage/methylation domain-containing protein, partial [Oscillospiraceae bacterium]|nr:prepilin-type N-terminal cleavage/methylation domain-containing protein [Oscillospiraceae bacterium]
MAVYRLYRLRSNKAFTLVETVISMVLTAVASLFLLSSVTVTANMISMSAELRRELSIAEDA